MSLVYHTNLTKKMKTENEIRPKRWERLWCKGFTEKISLETGVEQRWSDA